MSTETDRVRICEALGGNPYRWQFIYQHEEGSEMSEQYESLEAAERDWSGIYGGPNYADPIKRIVRTPNYFEDANAALQICEFMRGKGFTFECMCKKDGTWNVAFWAWRADKEQPERYSAIELANQPAAICAAFCQFLDSEKGDGR